MLKEFSEYSEYMMRSIHSGLERYFGLFALSPIAPFVSNERFLKWMERFLGIPEDPQCITDEVRNKVNHHLGGAAYWGEGRHLGRRVETLTNRLLGHYSREQRNLSPDIYTCILPVPKLPCALESTVIYQVTDPHINELENFLNPDIFQMLIDKLNADILKEKESSRRPIILVFTGDLFTDNSDSANLGLQKKAKDALCSIGADYKFAVLGNHDFFIGKPLMERLLVDAEFCVLANSASQHIEIGNARLQITGSESVLCGKQTPDEIFTPETSSDVVRIHLVHEPMGVVDVLKNTRNNVALVLSGHTHGGQKGILEKPIVALEELTGKVNRRMLYTAGLERMEELSRAVLGEEGNVQYTNGIYRSNGGLVFIINPGIGQIYVPTRYSKSMVTKFVLKNS